MKESITTRCIDCGKSFTIEVEINNSPLMKSDFLNKMEEKVSTLFKHIMLNRNHYENIY